MSSSVTSSNYSNETSMVSLNFMLSQEPSAQKTSNIPRMFMFHITHRTLMIYVSHFPLTQSTRSSIPNHVIYLGSHSKINLYQGFTRHNIKCTLIYLRYQLCKLNIADSRSQLVVLNYEVALDLMSSVTYANMNTQCFYAYP